MDSENCSRPCPRRFVLV